MANIAKLFNRVISGMAAVSTFLIIFIMLSICAEVGMRQIFNKPLMWTIEISEYLQVYVTFFGAAWVLRNEGHVRLDIFINLFKKTPRRVLYYTANLIGALTVLSLLFVSGWAVCEQYTLKTPVIKSLEIQKWIILLPLPIGSFFMFIEFVGKIFSEYRKNR